MRNGAFKALFFIVVTTWSYAMRFPSSAREIRVHPNKVWRMGVQEAEVNFIFVLEGAQAKAVSLGEFFALRAVIWRPKAAEQATVKLLTDHLKSRHAFWQR